MNGCKKLKKKFFQITVHKLVKKIWQSPLMGCLLSPLSWIFLGITQLRRMMFLKGYWSSQPSPVPLIIIGGLTAGGSGKTPIVIALAQALAAQGWKPGIISRAYGAKIAKPRAVNPNDHAQDVADEPLLIAQNLPNIPVWVHPQRCCCIRDLIAAHPQTNVIISDDGLQHYALQRLAERDIEVVVLDLRYSGNRKLLPAGPWREPADRKRDFTLYTGSPPETLANNAFVTHFVLDEEIRQLCYPERKEKLQALTRYAQEEILAVAAIAYPEKFFTALQKLGLLFKTQALPDHFVFPQNIFANKTARWILVTEKDAVKLQLIKDQRIWVVTGKAQLDPRFVAACVQKITHAATQSRSMN